MNINNEKKEDKLITMSSSVEYNTTCMAKADTRKQLSNCLHILYIHSLKF